MSFLDFFRGNSPTKRHRRREESERVSLMGGDDAGSSKQPSQRSYPDSSPNDNKPAPWQEYLKLGINTFKTINIVLLLILAIGCLFGVTRVDITINLSALHRLFGLTPPGRGGDAANTQTNELASPSQGLEDKTTDASPQTIPAKQESAFSPTFPLPRIYATLSLSLLPVPHKPIPSVLLVILPYASTPTLDVTKSKNKKTHTRTRAFFRGIAQETRKTHTHTQKPQRSKWNLPRL